MHLFASDDISECKHLFTQVIIYMCLDNSYKSIVVLNIILNYLLELMQNGVFFFKRIIPVLMRCNGLNIYLNHCQIWLARSQSTCFSSRRILIMFLKLNRVIHNIYDHYKKGEAKSCFHSVFIYLVISVGITLSPVGIIKDLFLCCGLHPVVSPAALL